MSLGWMEDQLLLYSKYIYCKYVYAGGGDGGGGCAWQACWFVCVHCTEASAVI